VKLGSAAVSFKSVDDLDLGVLGLARVKDSMP
jgi:hypothetical protein